ncbi:hypothetical protein [Tautonia sociabilis]|uniref:Uncharacterized protein n=1 Tax=Tautonia sociabilis TaxID=2080755 RepID=A0A432MRN9_9BACT|nr:hypothetical protein [Tautonia sociabilis]RUL89615.1 hypothetical protein TsocGM_00125 [Tautonia sociabilis]
MSLSTAIAAALDAWPDQPGIVSAQDGPDRLELTLSSNAPVGVMLEHLDFAVSDPSRSPWTIDELRGWADRLAKHVTYLMEPLVVLEVDAQGGEVELRSQSPTPRGQLRSYYEVRLNVAGTLRLHRVAFDATDRKRRPTPFQLSREVLERLADDLADTAHGR